MTTRRLQHLLKDQRGESDVIAAVILAPVGVALVALVIFLGRQVDARAQVRTAAEAAAQAAAQQRDPATAADAARHVATSMLTAADSCPTPQVQIDLSQFAPGGTVTVTVTCVSSTQGVEFAGAPKTVLATTAVAVVDRYRSGPLP